MTDQMVHAHGSGVKQKPIDNGDSIERADGRELGPADYVRAGFALVPIPAGLKGPEGSTGWDARENCVTTEVGLARITGNVGLAHAYSATASLDLDDLERAAVWFGERGVDVYSLLDAPDAVRIVSGREGRAKLLYRLPTPLRTIQRCTYRGADGKKHKALELRCATATGKTHQCVLPPSIHPDTGRPYAWSFDPLFADPLSPPMIPEELLKVWRDELSAVPERKELPAPTGASADAIRALLAKHDPGCPRDEWVGVVASVHYDTQGSDEGLALADEWSSRGENYKGTEDVAKLWDSLRLDHPNPRTLASLRLQEPASPDEFPLIEEPNPKRSKILLRHIADIIAERREPEWLIADVLEANVLAVLAGPRGTFKSFVSGEWAHRTALAGHPVVILSGEGAGLDRRSDAWFHVHGHGVEPSSVPIVALEHALRLNDPAVLAELVAAIEALPWLPRLLVIDTLSKYAAGLDENDNAAMAAFLMGLAVGLRDRFRCTVLLVAHSGHSDPGRPRGASSLMANPDAEYIVIRPDPAAMDVLVTRERFKDTPSLPPLAYRAEVVDLGRVDRRGQPVTSLALREVDAPRTSRAAKAPKLGDLQQLVLDALMDVMGPAGDPVPVRAVVEEAVRRMALRPDAKRDTRRQHATEALAKLQSKRLVTIADDHVGRVA